jgi:hypothetical protein
MFQNGNITVDHADLVWSGAIIIFESHGRWSFS